MEEIIVKKCMIISVVLLVLIFFSGCDSSLSISDGINEEMFIKSVTFNKEEIVNIPIGNFITKTYDYSINKNIKTVLIEVSDYSNTNKPIIISSSAFRLPNESLNGRMYINYSLDENELSFEIKTENGTNKTSNNLKINNLTDECSQVFLSDKSEIKVGKPIPIVAILYAESFSTSFLDNFLNNPKNYDQLNNAYHITITFSDKEINENK